MAEVTDGDFIERVERRRIEEAGEEAERRYLHSTRVASGRNRDVSYRLVLKYSHDGYPDSHCFSLKLRIRSPGEVFRKIYDEQYWDRTEADKAFNAVVAKYGLTEMT